MTGGWMSVARTDFTNTPELKTPFHTVRNSFYFYLLHRSVFFIIYIFYYCRYCILLIYFIRLKQNRYQQIHLNNRHLRSDEYFRFFRGACDGQTQQLTTTKKNRV